ncbi:squalene--hopene cyclase [Thalassoglobus sp.]|uniref:squalene--hopene cyclase n=1 Tax=Thalassoglobus sp. TaxID=2795869 RepID=UPI003AA9669D
MTDVSINDTQTKHLTSKLCLVCLVLFAGFLLPTFAAAQDSELRYGDEVPAEVEEVYQRGLNWLVENQSENGSWGGSQIGHGGSGNSGITGMCVMAFLASGEDPNFGKYQKNICAAVRNLIRSQDAKTGYLPGSMYHHGFAMLGLSEVYGVLDDDLVWQGETDLTNKRTIGEALELAVRCAVTSQKNNQWGAWRYSPESNDADTSVSGAVLMGLLAARNAGIKVPDESIDKALEYFAKMTTKQGSVGYSGIGGGGSRNLQAISTLVLSIGHRKEIDQFAGLTRQITNNLEYPGNSYPFYFRYYMAQALFQADFESWKKWNQLNIRQIQDMQSDSGSFRSQHGEAYGTAMSMLALALNYRFLPIYER